MLVAAQRAGHHAVPGNIPPKIFHANMCSDFHLTDFHSFRKFEKFSNLERQRTGNYCGYFWLKLEMLLVEHRSVKT